MAGRVFAAFAVINVLVPTVTYSSTISNIEMHGSLAQVEAATASYDAVFPYYTVQCSFSRARDKNGQSTSYMGHTVLYLKGACRDKSVPYPKLKMCDPGSDLTNQASGVALSVEKIVSNSQYVPTDGMDFLLNGSSSPDEPITIDTVRKTMQDVIASGSLNGLTIHDSYLLQKPADVNVAEYLAWIGVGTDFGVSFGRDATCARILMTESQIQAEVNYVNETNEPFISGAQKYSWSAVGDNCAHFTRDVLAAGGIRTAVPRNNSLSRVVYNLVSFHWEIPSNDVLKDLEFANDISKIRSAKDVYNDRSERELFNRLGTLPQLGATLQEIPMHLFQNSMYEPNSPSTFLLDFPVVENRGRKFNSLERDPVYTDITANLQRVLTRLEEVKTGAQDAPEASKDSSELSEFSGRYNTWIDQAILDIKGKLAKASELKLP